MLKGNKDDQPATILSHFGADFDLSFKMTPRIAMAIYDDASEQQKNTLHKKFDGISRRIQLHEEAQRAEREVKMAGNKRKRAELDLELLQDEEQQPASFFNFGSYFTSR